MVRSLATLLVWALFLEVPSWAQSPFDHLKCHKVRDQLAIKGLVDLDALQPQFSDRGCRLGKAKLFCAPVSKTLLAPPVVHPEIVGQSLTDDYICYRLKCPIRPAGEEVSDQLGTRPVRLFRSSLLCVPATTTSSRTPCGPGGLSCDSASEICVSRYVGGPGPVYSCEPIPAGCESERTCGCMAPTLCQAPVEVCQDVGPNAIFCDCPPCV